MNKQSSFKYIFNEDDINCQNTTSTPRHTIISILSDSKFYNQNCISKDISGIYINLLIYLIH